MDVKITNGDRSDEVQLDGLRSQIRTVLSDMLPNDNEILRKSAVALNDEKREAVASHIWANNGWMDANEALRYERGEEREKHRISYRELVSMVNKSAAKAKEALDNGDGSLDDAMTPMDAPILIPKIIVNVMREGAEPLLIGTSLMRQIRNPGGETITFPAAGGFEAEDIGPGQEYPEKSLEFSGIVTAKIGKSGVKVRLTDEVLRYSMFDVMSLHFQAAGRAMARHKETKVWNLIDSAGTVSFDNGAGASVHGKTTGRDLSGAGNDTFTLNDLFVMYADLLNEGFVPNVLCVNPMGWLLFARDSHMRQFAYQSGNPSMLWQKPQGTPGKAPHWSQGGVNMGVSSGNPTSLTPGNNTTASTYTDVPGFFPTPFRMAVSPFVTYDTTNRTTSIIMADVNQMGILVTDEELVAESWDDPNRDIVATKLRERYALALDNEGDAVTVAKNVSIAQGYDWENKGVYQPIPSGSGLPAIDGTGL